MSNMASAHDPRYPALSCHNSRLDRAYENYREYCRLFNVPEPAAKIPFGRYSTKSTRLKPALAAREIEDGNKVSYRYYPGLFLVKSPVRRMLISSLLHYGSTTDSISNTTDITRIYLSNNNNSNKNTTDTTDNRVTFRCNRRIRE